MSNIEKVKDLRGKTGAGIMDCHTALTKCGGDLEAAEQLIKIERYGRPVEIRPCGAGVIHSYIHTGDRIGVMVEVECGTDFAAKTDEFRTFVHDLAMHIAALKPSWVSPEDVTWNTTQDGDEEVDSVRYLVLQPFIKDGSKSIGDLLVELSARIGEPVSIRRFARWEIGEEIPPETTQPLDKPKGPMVAAAVVILLAIGATLFLMLCV
jgi:elongation factor Ts